MKYEQNHFYNGGEGVYVLKSEFRDQQDSTQILHTLTSLCLTAANGLRSLEIARKCQIQPYILSEVKNQNHSRNNSNGSLKYQHSFTTA